MEMPATEVCTYDDGVEKKSFQFFVWFMYDQGFSFQGLSSVNVLLITVSKNLGKKLMKKDFAIFESVNNEK